MPVRIPFDNTFARLPARFFARLDPTLLAPPRLVRVNAGLADDLGLDPDGLAGPEGVEVLAGNRVPEGAEPIALAYAGHQFGHFVPQLGDGRAILLGEVMGRDGARRDEALAGVTTYNSVGQVRGAGLVASYRGTQRLTPSNAGAAFEGTAPMVESERDDTVPHAVVTNYLAAFRCARTVTYRRIEGADHGLSDRASQEAYASLLMGWATEMALGARGGRAYPAGRPWAG